MATVAERHIRAASDRKFFSSMAIALLVTAFVGFAPTYFLMIPMHGKPLSLVVHLHGMVATAWLLLLVTQTQLVATGRTALHRRLGIIGALLAIGIVVLGLVVALAAMRHGRTNPGTLPPPALLAVQFTTIGLFASFATLGILKRGNAASHKRFMLLAAIALILPALARLSRMIDTWPLPPTPVGGMIISNLFLLALAMHDWRTLGRLHPVTLWGGLAYIVWEPLRIIIGVSAPWQAFVRSTFG